ncbi:Uncharacterised protein [uncultured archaeon]|nr:Uncharacterised protein [uncultured archaeon]
MLDRSAICDAYYMFASLYHAGQFSKEYAYFGRLIKLGYKPGLGVQSQDPDRLDESAREVYDRLVANAEGPSRAAREKLANKVARIIRFVEYEVQKTKNWQLRSFVDSLQLHFNGYAEPGYTDPQCGIIATGNWNAITKWEGATHTTLSKTPEIVGRLFDKLGIETEWLDEWCSCSDCGKLVRTSPDSMSWTPSYTLGDGELICCECKEPKDSNDELDDES